MYATWNTYFEVTDHLKKIEAIFYDDPKLMCVDNAICYGNYDWYATPVYELGSVVLSGINGTLYERRAREYFGARPASYQEGTPE